MRLLLIADADSIHTRRWVSSLSQRGCEILLFNLLRCDCSFYDGMPHVQVYSCDFVLDEAAAGSQRIAAKLIYLKAVKHLRRQIRRFRPDLLHAHNASSCGLVGALSCFHPFLLSVWGSDVYTFPRQGKLYNHLLRFALRRADGVLSTSHCMARETNKYTAKPIQVTPFGVDMNRFAPIAAPSKPATFVVGNVKALKYCYGIDTLIRAFALVCRRNSGKDMRLLIAGTGPDRADFEQLCDQLAVRDKVEFLGFIPNDELPSLYAQFDVAVSLSREESFGVVAVEAMSCQCPVVTSDAEGFQEVVADGVTGFVVPKDNAQAAADAIQKFIDDPQLRQTMGEAGRRRVAERYDWEQNVDTMMEIYRDVKQAASGGLR